MRRLLVFVLFVSFLYIPAFAEFSMRMDGKYIVLTADSDCEIEQFIKATEEIEKENLQVQKDTAFIQHKDSTSVKQAGEVVVGQTNENIKNKIGPNIPFISPSAFSRVSNKSIVNADLPDDYDEIKLDMIRDIRNVNWKTGYNISARDLTFWDRLAFVCGRVSDNFVVPAISTMGIPEGLISSEEMKAVADSSVQQLTKALEYAVMDSKLKHEVRYTPEGLYFAIITDNPFLLLTIDDDVYAVLEATEMKILKQYGRTKDDRLLGILFQNMHTFFDLRAKFENINPKFRENTKALLKMSKQGAGDAWSTYKLLADHMIRLNELLNQHVLTDDYEKNTFIALRKLFIQIGEDVKKHHTQERVIRKDPANAAMVNRVDSEYKHFKNVKEEALKELQDSPEADKELILRAYKKD